MLHLGLRRRVRVCVPSCAREASTFARRRLATLTERALVRPGRASARDHPFANPRCDHLVAAHLPHSHLAPSKPGRRPNGNNSEPVPRRAGRVADRRRSAMVRCFLAYILIPHSEQATAWQVDADDVHGAVARCERGAVAGVDGTAIVPNGAAARGDADPEPQAVAQVRTPAFCLRLASMTWRGRGACLRVQLRALSGNACAAYERWGRGERDAAFPRHGRDKAAGTRRARGGEGRRLHRAGRLRDVFRRR
jgi:hypothetical protein